MNAVLVDLEQLAEDVGGRLLTKIPRDRFDLMMDEIRQADEIVFSIPEGGLREGSLAIDELAENRV